MDWGCACDCDCDWIRWGGVEEDESCGAGPEREELKACGGEGAMGACWAGAGAGMGIASWFPFWEGASDAAGVG
jgi:hypothetical protein